MHRYPLHRNGVCVCVTCRRIGRIEQYPIARKVARNWIIASTQRGNGKATRVLCKHVSIRHTTAYRTHIFLRVCGSQPKNGSYKTHWMPFLGHEWYTLFQPSAMTKRVLPSPWVEALLSLNCPYYPLIHRSIFLGLLLRFFVCACMCACVHEKRVVRPMPGICLGYQ